MSTSNLNVYCSSLIYHIRKFIAHSSCSCDSKHKGDTYWTNVVSSGGSRRGNKVQLSRSRIPWIFGVVSSPTMFMTEVEIDVSEDRPCNALIFISLLTDVHFVIQQIHVQHKHTHDPCLINALCHKVNKVLWITVGLCMLITFFQNRLSYQVSHSHDTVKNTCKQDNLRYVMNVQ